MQVESYSDIFSTWTPKYRLKLRPNGKHRVYHEGVEPYDFWDCEWVITEESLEEGIEIADRALRADKIHQDARRQVELSIAKAQILASIPKVFKANSIALTVCPETGDHLTMLQIASIVANISAVSDGKFVIEQRSKPGEQPYGWHLHFLIQCTYAPSKIKQFVQQKLASRGYTCTYYATKADERWLKNYMSGSKGNAEKDQKVQQDRILRKQLELQDMYELLQYKK